MPYCDLIFLPKALPLDTISPHPFSTGENDPHISCLWVILPSFMPQVLEMLDSLNGEWVSFQQTLLDSEQMLKKNKEKFKTGLIHSADDFKKKAHTLLEDFEFKGSLFPNSHPPNLAFVLRPSLQTLGPGKVRTRMGGGGRQELGEEPQGAKMMRISAATDIKLASRSPARCIFCFLSLSLSLSFLSFIFLLS